MAQFRGTIKGQRGIASRLGSKKSGLDVYVNGWHSGIRVKTFVDQDGNDVFEVYRTNGSTGSYTGVMIARLTGSNLSLTAGAIQEQLKTLKTGEVA